MIQPTPWRCAVSPNSGGAEPPRRALRQPAARLLRFATVFRGASAIATGWRVTAASCASAPRTDRHDREPRSTPILPSTDLLRRPNQSPSSATSCRNRRRPWSGCRRQPKTAHFLECAPVGGQGQAAVLSGRGEQDLAAASRAARRADRDLAAANPTLSPVTHRACDTPGRGLQHARHDPARTVELIQRQAGTAGTNGSQAQVPRSVSPHGVEFAERAMRGSVTGYGKRARFRLSVARWLKIYVLDDDQVPERRSHACSCTSGAYPPGSTR